MARWYFLIFSFSVSFTKWPVNPCEGADPTWVTRKTHVNNEMLVHVHQTDSSKCRWWGGATGTLLWCRWGAQRYKRLGRILRQCLRKLKAYTNSGIQHSTSGHKSNRNECLGPLIYMCLGNSRASLIAQLGKNLPSMQETWVQFLGWEDPLENKMATHSSILAWRIS